MANNRTEDTSNVPAEEAHTRLLRTIELLLGLSKRFIDNANSLLERRELGHGIRDLARPQWIQPLIQPAHTLFRNKPSPSLPHGIRIRRQRRLHAHLDRLERTQGHISEELCGRAGAEEDHGAVGVREQVVAVQVLEVLVEAVLASALERVADESGRPAEEHAAQALLGEDGTPGGDVGGVDLGVDLSAAFDQVEGCDGGVGWSCLFRSAAVLFALDDLPQAGYPG